MKNNNLDLANDLDDIALKISAINFTSTQEILHSAEKTLKHIDQIAKKMDIPSLRALSHWMLLNTEQHDNNKNAISELSTSGSYFNWIEILPAILRNEDQSLYQDLYDNLHTPNWFIKPSNILLNNLISWLEATTKTKANITQITTSESSNEKLITKTKEALIIDNCPSGNNNKGIITGLLTQKTETTKISYDKPSNNECFGLLNLELDEVVMSLINLSNTSEDTLEDSEKFNNKLEHLINFSKKCSYSSVIQITRWCQRNLDLFSRNKSQLLYRFVESGECWAWLELLSYGISDPDELSNISLLTVELSREEWIEAIPAEDLQNLLLFLKAPKDHSHKPQQEEASPTNTAETHKEEETNLSFSWDADIHPELLSAYFEETPELVAELAVYLHRISKDQTSEEDHQHASRIAHTIKGSSAVLGITALSEFSHKLEDILDYSVKNKLSKDTSDFLAESSDCLENLFEAIQSQQTAPEEFPQVLKKLEYFSESLDTDVSDNELLQLSEKPTLPSFIKQANNINQTNSSIKEVDLSENFQAVESTDNSATLEKLEQGFDIKEFTAEIDDIAMSLSTIYMHSDTPFTDFDKAQEELQRLDLLSEISGYAEISNISQWCQYNLNLFKKEKTDSSKKFIISGECWTWIELIGVSLADPTEKSYIPLLSQELRRSEWLEPLAKNDLQKILLLLSSRDSKQQQQKNTDNPHTESTAQDNNNTNRSKFTLKWDEDIHPELLDVYLQETPDQIDEAAQLIHKIADSEATKDDHQHAARLVHTIKGASGVVGITALAELTHKLEDILDYSVEHQLPNEASVLLSESVDCLEDLFDAIINKKEEPKEFSLTLLKLSKYAKFLETTHKSDDLDELNKVELTAPKLPDFINTQNNNQTNKIENNSNKSINPSEQHKLAQQNTEIQKHKVTNTQTPPENTTETHIRVPIAVIDKLLNLAGELVTASTQISDKIHHSLVTNKQIKNQDDHIHKMLEELSSTISRQEKNQTSMLSSLKNSNFDSLEMDTYNELHSIAGLLTESILDGEEIDNHLGQQLSELNEYTRSLAQLNKELSNTILNSRMVSVNTLVPRLERIIRQTCRKTGKKAELTVSGNSINVDTDILNKLTDPLLHLLRNSIDHGIEHSEDRTANSKYETGRINLTFSREGKYIRMKLADDGAGIDPDKIYQHALEKGLIHPDNEYTENEILQFILQPGFSTQEKVTDISGRGVGMDVVANAVKLLNGTLEINSKKGLGTIFTINVPLTLITSGTLLVKISGAQIGIPVDTIEQLFYLAPNKVLEQDGAHFIEHNDKKLPIISLANLLSWPVTKPDFSEANTLLLIKGKKVLHAIYIDEVIHSREVVIKSLAPWINTDKGLIGACHLADGGVAPVISLSRLLAQTEANSEITEKYQVTLEPKNLAKETPKILVVDDSLSNRKALSLIIEQTEYDVLTAVDGLDALQIMNENQIDIVYTDLEMPRMNGLELTQSIRAWDAKKHIPIVMITSRTTTKHQQLAAKAGVNQYLTKPVITDTLLNSIEHWLKKDLAILKTESN